MRDRWRTTPFGTRQFFARMNGERWPKDARLVSLTRVLTGLRKALVKSVGGGSKDKS